MNPISVFTDRMRSVSPRFPGLPFFLAVCCLFALTACQKAEPVPADQPPASSATPAAPAERTKTYVTEFPACTYEGERSLDFSGRSIILKDVPENTAEELVADYYLTWFSGDFDAHRSLLGSDDLLEMAELEKSLFADGVRFDALTIHSLTLLTADDLSPFSDYFDSEQELDKFTSDMAALTGSYDLSEYTVVCANLSWTWSQAALDLGPQLGNGRYERLFLLGRATGGDTWSIYELFWGESVLGRTLEPVNDPLAETLARLGFDDYDHRTDRQLTTLLFQTIGTHSLVLVKLESFPHVAGLDNLVMGVLDEESQQFVGPVYTIGGDEAGYTSWMGSDGCLYVLWSNTTVYQGDGTSNGVGYFRFDGQTLTPVYDLPDAALNCGILPDTAQTSSILHPVADHPDSYAFWFTRKAWPVSKGFQLYEKNPDWGPAPDDDPTQTEDKPQWIYIGYVPFGTVDAEVTPDAKNLITQYLHTTWPASSTYYLDEAPNDPQAGDQRIDSVSYIWEEATGETFGVAFQVDRSCYISDNDASPGQWESQNDTYLILGKKSDGSFYEVRGHVDPSGELSLNQLIVDISQGQSTPTSLFPQLEQESISLLFSSGAGAWGTELTLFRDGSFTGSYHDTEMGDLGPDYPNGTVYVCSFRGRFDYFEFVSPTTVAMSLSQLELTTIAPKGSEWIEDGIRYVSSGAHGLEGGTEFLLCSPGTPLDTLPEDCLTWYHPIAPDSSSTLPWFALCNLTDGFAFFSM